MITATLAHSGSPAQDQARWTSLFGKSIYGIPSLLFVIASR